MFVTLLCCRFGYVDVKPEDVDRALELSGKELNGEPIRIDRSKPKTPQEDGRLLLEILATFNLQIFDWCESIAVLLHCLLALNIIL